MLLDRNHRISFPQNTRPYLNVALSAGFVLDIESSPSSAAAHTQDPDCKSNSPLYISSSLTTFHADRYTADEWIRPYTVETQSLPSSVDNGCEFPTQFSELPPNLELLDCANAERNAFGTLYLFDYCILHHKVICPLLTQCRRYHSLLLYAENLGDSRGRMWREGQLWVVRRFVLALTSSANPSHSTSPHTLPFSTPAHA
jgi:hypothetical protein